MKKQLAKFALTAVLGLAITFTLNACEEKGGGGGGKLLETITDQNGTRKFEYDKQNRIVKIGNETITYADNLITVGTDKYAISGNTITIDGRSFTINGDGYIVNGNGADYKYKDGNLISSYWSEVPCTDNYSYDNKKSPFSGSTTPKWLIQRLLLDIYASKNNVVSSEQEVGKSTYKYEYDSDGFPVKFTKTFEGNDDGKVVNTTTRFAYRGEPQTATATEPTAEEKIKLAEAVEAERARAAAEAAAANAYAAMQAEKPSGSTLTDTRDSKTYKTVKIGEQVWMAENLNFEAKGSKCYENDHNCKKYGRIYDWNTAKTACPSGWHLPAEDEWKELLRSGSEKELIEKMKPRNQDGWWTSSGGDDTDAKVFHISEQCGEDECTNIGYVLKISHSHVRCIQN